MFLQADEGVIRETIKDSLFFVEERRRRPSESEGVLSSTERIREMLSRPLRLCLSLPSDLIPIILLLMLSEKIQKLIEAEFPGNDISVTVPEVQTHGHFTTNLAFSLAKKERMSPMQAAEKIKSAVIAEDPEKLIEKIEVAAPGFVNFWLTPKSIQDIFARISQSKNFGKSKVGDGRKIIVEYSSPNIAKPMHVGHFRATIIGDALANIHKALGYKVIRWNYLGDWGVQFGKLTAAYKMWGDAKKLKAEPIKHLLELYVRFSAQAKINPEFENLGQLEFKKLENGDKGNRKLWELFRKVSLKDFDKVYKMLGVKFDVEIGESFYESHLKPLTKSLVKDGIAKRSEGALIIDLEKYGLPRALVEKSDGASLYLTRDLANIKYRLSKYKTDKIIHVVGQEQSLHFQQFFRVAEMLGLGKDKFFHVGTALVLGPDGKKLSTREGKTIFIEDIINEALSITREIVKEKNSSVSAKEREKIAKVVAIGALKYNDLSQSRLSNIIFDWNKMLSFEGDSGPYLQYTYVRLKSILRKMRPSKFDPKVLALPGELDLILKLDRFPEAIQKSAETFYPHYLAQYLYDLAKSASRFYEEHPVLKAESAVRKARLALISCAADALKTGLNLLGVETLERM